MQATWKRSYEGVPVDVEVAQSDVLVTTGGPQCPKMPIVWRTADRERVQLANW